MPYHVAVHLGSFLAIGRQHLALHLESTLELMSVVFKVKN